MRIPSSLWRLVSASVGLLVLAVSVSAQTPTPELYFRARDTPADPLTERQLTANSPLIAPRGRLPVLFVHGHNPDDDDDPPNYRQNWQESLNGLPSFMATLDLNDNHGLGIEDYYIRFSDQNRSIADDAAEIGAAIELILHRHDTGYPARGTTNVQVVIIAYSKGTLSTRLYLKNLAEEGRSFRPVSEFVAIAPPNHGLNVAGASVLTSTAVQQMVNGHGLNNCSQIIFPAATRNFIANLNGHPITDTEYRPTSASDPTPLAPATHESEAPDSRSPTERLTEGILYVTLFADSNRDFVGGDTIIGPQNRDCQGRRLAKNLSPNAVNIPIAGIVEEGWRSISSFFGTLTDEQRKAIAVHQNTVHTPEVICKALYAAVHHRSPLCATCTLDNSRKPVIPPQVRAAAMLTLDFSGSMAAPAGPSLRVNVLKDAVVLFLDIWSQFGDQSDRLGVTYFRTDVEPFNPVSGQPMPPFSDGRAAIIQNLIGPPGQTPSNLTAMGGGLQVAIEALRDPSVAAQVRRVILFTDGMQNVNPMVLNVNGQLVIADEPGRSHTNIPSPSPPTALNSKLCVAIDTIGVGAGTAFTELLNHIAIDTGGRTWVTPSPEEDLRQFFIEVLINALRGFSPQLVAYRHGALAPAGSTEPFAIENGVRKLVLKVSWQRGNSLDFTVARDGVDVTSAGRFIGGDFYKIFVIDLPASGRIAARGNWEVRINGKAGTSYEAAAIVDGSPISYDSNFDLKRPRAGEPLDLVVRLTAGGQPVTDTRVSVILLSPTITAGDIIARNPPKDLPAFEPGMSIGERQLLALAQDPKRSAGLKPKPTKLELQPTGKGDFRARISTDVPGIYTAFVTIEGSNPQLGQFSRTLTMTSVVRFANADRKASDIFASECDAGSGRRYVRIFLSPRDTKGHFMGPGSPSEIALELSTGRVVGSTRDLGDGSYAILLEVPAGADPSITLKVAGAALFTGRLSQLSGKTRR